MEKIKYNIDKVKELRINDILEHFSSYPLVEHFDFTTIGLTKEAPLYEKGRKTEACYTNDNGDIVVKKVFTDIENSDGLIVALEMKVIWYTHDNKEGITKVQIIKKFNNAEAKTIYRKRRQRAIDYLEASAEEKGFGWIIDLILENFKQQLELFILSGNSIFKDALQAETTNSNSKLVLTPGGQQVPLSYILNQKLPPTQLYPEGQKVVDGIIEEIM